MPNVIRKVTRSTMIQQYLQYCSEENFEPLSRATLFRILDVRGASQRKSLAGLDNIAAEGSAGFERLLGIVDELDTMGLEKCLVEELKRSLRNGKSYLGSTFANHCQGDDSRCPDHCRKFALSDPVDKDFQQPCDHEHNDVCSQCDELTVCLYRLNELVKAANNVTFYSDEQKDDFLYDIEKATNSVLDWKAHIMRSVNQERAKQGIIAKLDSKSYLIIMDWAMKFLQLRFREKQSDWYGKRGLSWHVSSVVSRNEKREAYEVVSYVHLFDQCTQDWFAVTSIIENLLAHLKSENPQLQQVYLRSDEAGCYHSNFLIAAVKDIGLRVGVTVAGYHFSEPQCGKDICDRILCPLKSSIRTYCNEGNNVLSASDMKKALQQHPVKGTMSCVTVIDESKKSLHINKLEEFNSYHNFHYNNHGVRVWKCYEIGRGKVYDYDDIYVEHQAPTMMQAQEPDLGFRDPLLQKRILKAKTQEASKKDDCEEVALFECSVSGCTKAFHSFSDLELHQDIGNHTKSSQYDIIRRDWAKKFRTVDSFSAEKAAPSQTCLVQLAMPESEAAKAKVGWALSKPRSTKRFSASVKEYLTARFMIGERTGRKADAAQVAIDMRTARDALNARIFHREDWLTKSQIQGFFSRLAAARRKEQGAVVGLSPENEEDIECIEEHADRQELLDLVNNEIKVAHPIYYDVYDLCECYRTDTLSKFSKTVLKSICLHFEIPFKSADLKKTLVAKIAEMVSECECVAN
jgi:hypothetical protein